jgi:hypothetical protein
MAGGFRTLFAMLLLASFCIGCGGGSGGPATLPSKQAEGLKPGTVPDLNPSVKSK